MTRQFDELKLTGNLPSPSGVGLKILHLTQNEDFTTEELARTLQMDPALTGRILKMANSVVSSGVTQVRSVPDAVVRLGMRTVRNVALGFSLISSYRGGRCKSFDYDLYWSQSLARAVAAQKLAKELRAAPPADAYICALLSGIGRLALASVHPQAYSDLITRVGMRSPPPVLAAAEHKVFEIDHLEVAEAMLADWRLPEAHGKAVVAFSKSAEEAPKLCRLGSALARVLGAAATIADTLTALKDAWYGFRAALVAAHGALDLPAERFAALCDEIQQEWQDWGRLLSIPTGTTPPFAEILSAAARPAADVPASSAPAVDDINAADVAIPESTIARLRVLAVDDDPVSRRLIVTHLKKAGYELIEAADGASALRLALECHPHIVVTDWVMPGMDGVELTRSLRKIEIGQDMYILLLTGSEGQDRTVEAFDAGVDDFIAKPFNPRILLSRVGAGERLVRLQDRVTQDKKRMQSQLAQLAVLNRQLRHISETDALTQLPNRRVALEWLEQAFERRGQEKAEALAVVFIDIDHFKKLNDTYGHEAGDAVLRAVAQLLKENLRKGDEVYRLGGEEFVLICPGADTAGARVLAERLRVAVEQQRIRIGPIECSITCSFGVAERTTCMNHQDDLLRAADMACYAAKEKGRNRVCVAAATSVPA